MNVFEIRLTVSIEIVVVFCLFVMGSAQHHPSSIVIDVLVIEFIFRLRVGVVKIKAVVVTYYTPINYTPTITQECFSFLFCLGYVCVCGQRAFRLQYALNTHIPSPILAD